MDLNAVFIVGPPRSGTTLLQAMLLRAAGPALVTVPETHFFSQLLPPLDAARSDEERVKIIADYCERFYRDRALITFDEFKDAGGVDWRKRFFARVIETLSGKTLEGMGDAVLLEKTPDHIFALDTIFSWFPRARVIVLFRNPVPTIASQCEQARFWPVKHIPLEVWIRRWRDAVRQYELWAHDERVRVVQYEKLISEPKVVIDSLLSWCGLSRALEDQTSASANFVLPHEHWKAEALSGRPTDNREKRVAPLWLRAAVWTGVQQDAARMGYRPSHGWLLNVFQPVMRALRFAELAEWQARRTFVGTRANSRPG